MDPDEGLHASIAQEMASGGDWVVPRSGKPFFDKPVLYSGPRPRRCGCWATGKRRSPLARPAVGLLGMIAVGVARAGGCSPHHGGAGRRLLCQRVLPDAQQFPNSERFVTSTSVGIATRPGRPLPRDRTFTCWNSKPSRRAWTTTECINRADVAHSHVSSCLSRHPPSVSDILSAFRTSVAS